MRLKADRPLRLRSPAPPKSQEREFERMLEWMIRSMSRTFRARALNGMERGTVEKFADANYAREFLEAVKRAKRALLRRFDDDRIEEMVDSILNKADRYNRSTLYAAVERRMGINSKVLAADEGLTFTLNALKLETAQWVKKLRDETLELYTSNTLQAMSQGDSLATILERFDGLEGKRVDHAKFTARNQIQNYNGISTKLRAQNLGIEKARWVTAGDDRVRASHADRDGKEFDLAKGLYSSVDGVYLLPGVDYQCRCTYELIIPTGDDENGAG